MRLIIVVTAPVYALWPKANEWEPAPNYDKTNVRVATIGSDHLLVLCQADGVGNREAEISKSSSAITTPWVIDVAKSRPFIYAEKVYVAAHDSFVNLSDLPQKLGSRYTAGAFFHHQPTQSALFDDLLKLFEYRNNDAFEITLETIVRHQVQSFRVRLVQLKYKINKICASIVWDIDGLFEVDFVEEYMAEVAKKMQDTDRILDSFRRLLYEHPDYTERDTVEKVLKETGQDEDASWKAIQTLLPPRESMLPFKDSHAYRFLKSLSDVQELKRLKSKLADQDNPVNKFVDGLDTALSVLADKVDSATDL